MRRTAVVSLGILVLAGAVTVSAQAPQGRGGGAAQPPPQNLQVLPKDMTRPQVVQIMQAFNAALGVTCAHCHVFIGAGDPMNDFAVDTKPAKNVARAMMRMAREVNPAIAKAVAPKAADQVAQVTCAMCHRGATVPVVAAGTPGAPPPPRGAGPGGAPGAGRGN
jgi:hypothetical protein